MSTTETYTEMQNRFSAEINALPLKFAFNDKQFDAMCESFGFAPEDAPLKLYSGYGGFYRREDSDLIRGTFTRHYDELHAAMKDTVFATDAFVYELCNHEYAYNIYQGDYDTLSAFGNITWAGEDASPDIYMDELGFSDDTKAAYYEARQKYYKMGDEGEWW